MGHESFTQKGSHAFSKPGPARLTSGLTVPCPRSGTLKIKPTDAGTWEDELPSRVSQLPSAQLGSQHFVDNHFHALGLYPTFDHAIYQKIPENLIANGQSLDVHKLFENLPPW